MKKNREFDAGYACVTKILRIMRLSVFFMFLFIAQTWATSIYSQETRLSLNMNNVKVRDVLSEIEKGSEFYFFFTEKLVDVDRNVNVNVKNVKIDEILQSLFQQSDITFKVVDRQIILTKRTSGNSSVVGDGKTFSGKVTDNTGAGLPGVSVVVKGTTTGVITDMDGKYSISNVPANAILQFSFVGMKSQELTAGNKTTINVTLAEDAIDIEEVVAVGYGTQKKVNLTGSVSSISIKDMTKRQVGQTSMALQGMVPGVTVVQRSGQPGADGGVVSIRGMTTLGNNSALVLVDGVEMNLNNVEPSLIESISVLKDAASASIYGSRAANGVILIKTKRAEKQKLSFLYNTYIGQQSPITLPDFVNAVDYMKMLSQAQVNVGKSPDYSPSYIQEYIENGSANRDKYPDTDWQKEVLTGSGMINSHFLTMSGGSEKISTIVSLGYFDQKGVTQNTNYKRYTFRTNTDLQLLKQLSAKVDAQFGYTNQIQPSRGTEGFYWMSVIPANQAAKYSNGNWAEGWNGDNPAAFNKDGGLNTAITPSVVLNFELNFKPTQWLTLNGKYAPKYYETHQSTFNKVVQTYKLDGSLGRVSPQISKLTESTSRALQNLITLSGTIERSFGIHNVKLIAGYQKEDITSYYHSGTRENYVFPDYPVLDAGGAENQKTSGDKNEWALQSLFGRINYDVKGKYLFEVNSRYDGSSRFAVGRKWGLFPSMSAGWRISEEEFWTPIKGIVNNFKLRTSWGQLGNQSVGNYAFISAINLAPKYMFDKKVNSGAALVDLANSEISWETTTITDIGLDLNLNEKLNITIDWYNKDTKGILLQLNVPLIIGMNAPLQNAGRVQNKGWDFSFDYADHIGGLSYRVGANFSDVLNKIIDLHGISQSSLTVNNEGFSMNSLFGLEAIGYIQPEDYDEKGVYKYATQYGKYGLGDIKYKDQITLDTNGDGIPDSGDGKINASDYKIIGHTIPRYTFGLTFDCEYRGFDFNMLLQGVGQVDGYLNGAATMAFQSPGSAQEQHKDSWTVDNRNSAFPRLTFAESNNQQNSSFWMKSASYLRLKNIQIGYSLPKSILHRTFFESIRIYATGSNLLTLDNFWDGFDAEAPVGNGQFYPQMKDISLGINVKF